MKNTILGVFLLFLSMCGVYTLGLYTIVDIHDLNVWDDNSGVGLGRWLSASFYSVILFILGRC